MSNEEGEDTTPPPYVIRSCKLIQMRNEEEDTTRLPYVIRSCELSEMSNEEQDNPTPTLTHPMSLGVVS